MGFSNTTYNNTTNSLVSGFQNRLNNPYYMFSDKKPTVVTYWNINKAQSTVDEGTKTPYDQIGKYHPFRYNKVNNMVLYGIPTFDVNYRVGEYGVESEIEGEAFILPNTIIPCVGDYFTINYLSENPILFKVMDVSPDTLESGANFYRIRYYIDKNDDMSLTYLNSRLLADEYEYIPSNVGTQYIVVMKKSNMGFLTRLQKTMETLKNYYISLFYHANIQTFVYRYHDMIIYDPYCIEFIIRNKVMNYVGEYMYIQQAVHYPYTFSIEYDNTIFKNVEEQDPELHLNSNYAVPVHDPNSLLVNRMEEYYELSVNLRNRDSHPINNIDMDLFDRIVNNNLYVSDEDPKLHKVPLYRNIIINHVNGNLEITEDMIVNLLNINYCFSKDLYYEIPLLLYCIQQYINGLQTNDTSGDYEDCFLTRT